MDNRPIIDWSAPMPEPLRGEERTPTLAEALAALDELGSRRRSAPWRNPHAARVGAGVKANRRAKGKTAKNARRRNR